MRYDEDFEIDPSFREERERAAAKAERERMIREQVVRVMSGAAAEDLAEDERLRLEQERQDSLDRVEAAGGNPIFEALQESSSASKSTVNSIASFFIRTPFCAFLIIIP